MMSLTRQGTGQTCGERQQQRSHDSIGMDELRPGWHSVMIGPGGSDVNTVVHNLDRGVWQTCGPDDYCTFQLCQQAPT